jgi:hypothetical protein
MLLGFLYLVACFRVSEDRHRAEIRRAVNDEELEQIADKLFDCWLFMISQYDGLILPG